MRLPIIAGQHSEIENDAVREESRSDRLGWVGRFNRATERAARNCRAEGFRRARNRRRVRARDFFTGSLRARHRIARPRQISDPEMISGNEIPRVSQVPFSFVVPRPFIGEDDDLSASVSRSI